MSRDLRLHSLTLLTGALILGAFTPPAFGDDCNTNGVDDASDIAAATSLDCNSNAVPDECDISAATSADCNGNAVPDECDTPLTFQLAKLVAADATAGDELGTTVAISGDTAIVGAHFADIVGNNSGAAYVFIPIGGAWVQQAKLAPPDTAAGDQFGINVAINGDTAVIGAWLDDDAGSDSGSAAIFVRSAGTWTQQAKLVALDAAANDNFGFDVAVSADTVVVGAHSDDGNRGAAYVFVRAGGVWSQQAKLVASDPVQGKIFGNAVGVSGDTAIIGAPGDSHAGVNSGAAYVFLRSGQVWSQQAKLVASDAAAGDNFGGGGAVGISDDTAIVGARSDDDAGSSSGSAYVFVRSGTVWTQQGKLLADDAAAGDVFGNSVAVDGETAVIGAYSNDDAGSGSGSAYLFARTGAVWTQRAKLTAGDAAPADVFGYSVGVSGETAVIGAYQDDDGGLSSGSAYVLSLQPPPFDCNANDVLDECDIAGSTSDDCNNNLVPDECAADFDGDGVIDNCDADMDDDGVLNAGDICNLTPPAAGVQANGTLRADLDGDCDVDLVDFAIMQGEFTGP